MRKSAASFSWRLALRSPGNSSSYSSKGEGRFVIPGDRRKQEEPFVCSGLPSFVTLKGGDYFFAPSLTALRLLAAGLIDPR